MCWLPGECYAVYCGRDGMRVEAAGSRVAGACSVAWDVLESREAKSLGQKTETQCNLSHAHSHPGHTLHPAKPHLPKFHDLTELYQHLPSSPDSSCKTFAPGPQYLSTQYIEGTLSGTIASIGQK